MTSVHGVDYNQCLCLPKAELKTKTNPNGHHSVAVWVRFGFRLDSLEKKIDPPSAENRVYRGCLTWRTSRIRWSIFTILEGKKLLSGPSVFCYVNGALKHCLQPSKVLLIGIFSVLSDVLQLYTLAVQIKMTLS